MQKIAFADIELLSFGNDIQLVGMVYAGREDNYICLLPDEPDEMRDYVEIDMTLDDWKALFRQLDLMETEVISQDGTGLRRVILRKSERQIDQNVAWRVYQRDHYTCRYCGRTGIPLTVDHVVLWEEGGPSIEENLISACRRCNKMRGRMQYGDWLDSEMYRQNIHSLSTAAIAMNEQVRKRIPEIPVRLHKRSR